MIRYIVSQQVQNGIRNVRLSYQGTKNVVIYALSSGKFLFVRKYACVKDLTNIMSGPYPSVVIIVKLVIILVQSAYCFMINFD